MRHSISMSTNSNPEPIVFTAQKSKQQDISIDRLNLSKQKPRVLQKELQQLGPVTTAPLKGKKATDEILSGDLGPSNDHC
ncbi:hypothetical protein M5K25_017973 [Dendrobium thyrsiflorum]|uniref:Uncharacterized protein n=1 Tax=Dendrobium thyrsiflorum TaxID=117978 RepID=A0ABD0UHF4_DENTH